MDCAGQLPEWSDAEGPASGVPGDLPVINLLVLGLLFFHRYFLHPPYSLHFPMGCSTPDRQGTYCALSHCSKKTECACMPMQSVNGIVLLKRQPTWFCEPSQKAADCTVVVSFMRVTEIQGHRL